MTAMGYPKRWPRCSTHLPRRAVGCSNVGLGLWMTGYLIRRLGGRAEVEYPGVGTRVVVSLPVMPNEAFDAAA
jgi:signal transduction histidine kinase